MLFVYSVQETIKKTTQKSNHSHMEKKRRDRISTGIVHLGTMLPAEMRNQKHKDVSSALILVSYIVDHIPIYSLSLVCTCISLSLQSLHELLNKTATYITQMREQLQQCFEGHTDKVLGQYLQYTCTM